MGYNTTVLIQNDALSHIENDPEFGKNLVDAIKKLALCKKGETIDVDSKWFTNAATVIESHHADAIVVVAIGHGEGCVLGCAAVERIENSDEILRQLAIQHDYKLVKK